MDKLKYVIFISNYMISSNPELTLVDNPNLFILHTLVGVAITLEHFSTYFTHMRAISKLAYPHRCPNDCRSPLLL